MFAFMKPFGLGASAVGVGAIFVAAALAPLVAQAQASDAATVAPSGGEAQIVVKDADSGQLRAATPEEAQALQGARAQLRRSAAAGNLSKSHWSGAQGARLTDEFLSYSVVVKRADGTLVELCVEGAETTAKAVRSPAPAKSATLPTE